MKNLVLALATFACACSFGGPKYALPERLMSGYSGWFLGQDQEGLRWIMDRMSEAAFNSIELKIQSGNRRTFDLEGHLDEAEALMRSANEKGLLFQVYLYPIPHDAKLRREWSEHADLPCVVDREGKKLEQTFLITDARCWKQLFFHAFKFLQHHDRLSFATLKFDLETIPAAYSYDDANWSRFVASHPVLAAETPAEGRFSALKEANLAEDYERSFREETGKAIRAFIAALREVDPDVILGYMPSAKGSFHYVEMEKALATVCIPAVIDNWSMYNGEGYLDSTAELAAKTKALAAGNVSIPWIRPNSYAPGSIAPAVYQAACHTGGYSLWSLGMLCKGGNPRQGYSLPKGTTVEDYYAAFRKANLALRADIAEGTLAAAARIPREKTKPLAAPLDWSDIVIPDLKPVGDGSGEDQFICTRERQTFFIWAKAGEEIKLSLRHDAAEQRPIALHYILLNDRKERLREEIVNPGDTESWSVVAPKTGVYALVITGGQSGQAWYSVKVGGGLHYALDARAKGGAVIFRPQTVCLPGVEQGNPTVHFACGHSTVVITPEGKSSCTMKQPRNKLDFRLGTTKRCSFARHPEIGYFDGIDVSFPNGKCPFIWGTAGRGLVPVADELAFNLDFWYFNNTVGKANASAESWSEAFHAEDFGRFSADERGILAFADDVLRGQVTRFVMNVNGQRSNVDSKAFEPVWKHGLRDGMPEYEFVRVSKSFHDRGIDPYAIWTRRCREKGVEPWISVRMNDMHRADQEGCPSISDWWREHREFRRYPDSIPEDVWFWESQSLDFAHVEVRDRILAYIEECLAKYDVDGLELDWTRFPWAFAPGKERENAPLLTDLMRKIRRAADAQATKRGHGILISCRMLACPEMELALGREVDVWAREGLIDIADVGNHWKTADYEIPVVRWRKILGDGVKVVPHVDCGLAFEGGGGKTSRRLLTREEYLGWVDVMRSRGCTDFSLFNLFGHDSRSAEWNETLVHGFDPREIAASPRRYPLSYRDWSVTDADRSEYPQRLPCELDKDVAFELPIGTVSPSDGAELILGFADEREALPSAEINGTPLPPFLARLESGCHGFASVFPAEVLKSGHNRVRVSACGGRRLVYAAIRLVPDGQTVSGTADANRARNPHDPSSSVRVDEV